MANPNKRIGSGGSISMDLTTLQIALFRRFRTVVEGKPNRRIVYRSEWLGYLPYGAYHWIEFDNRDISVELPIGWSKTDLVALEKLQFLKRVDEWQNPTDEWDKTSSYEVM